MASGRSPAQLARFSRDPPGCGDESGRAWHLWSHSAARRPPFFGLVVSNPLVRRLLPAEARRSASPGGVGQARPPSHARASARFRRTGVSALAQTSLLTLEAASLSDCSFQSPSAALPRHFLKRRLLRLCAFATSGTDGTARRMGREKLEDLATTCDEAGGEPQEAESFSGPA